MLKDLTIVEFADETASNSPAPGGGSIAALNASMAASLLAMVAALTIGKKNIWMFLKEWKKSMLNL